MADVEKILDRKYQMTDGGQICNIRSLYTEFSPNVDIEALKKTTFFEAVERMMEPVLDVPDERSPEVMAYWAKRGMVKEFHGYDNPMSWDEYEKKTGYRWDAEKFNLKQNENKIWTSFVPVSAFKPENAGRKYPLVFALHGACNNIFLVEGWGFVEEAAKREWIVIIPSLELDDILEEILEEAKKLYPVDESRVYAGGFSYGGWASNRLGNQRPDMFAAVGPCGSAIDDGFIKGYSDDREPLPPFDGKPRGLELGVCMPVINIYGEHDGGRLPFYNFKGKPFHLMRMETAADLVEGLNSWAKVNRAPEVNIDDVLALRDRTDISQAERELGLPAGKNCVLDSFVSDGVQYHTADLISEDGVARVRIVAEMNIPHWPTPVMVPMMYEFFSHFSRDPVTKESIYTA